MLDLKFIPILLLSSTAWAGPEYCGRIYKIQNSYGQISVLGSNQKQLYFFHAKHLLGYEPPLGSIPYDREVVLFQIHQDHTSSGALRTHAVEIKTMSQYPREVTAACRAYLSGF